MALYVSAGTRRRRVLVIAGAALVVGLALGYVAGGAGSPSLSGEVQAVQARAAQATTALERLPIEYEQSLAGVGGESTGTIVDALDRAGAKLDEAYGAAIWLPEGASATTDAALADLAAAAAAGTPVADFAQGVTSLAEQIALTFALPAPASP
ncbi:MAG: hypothetical protein EXQ71_01585 [Acidimicrobiia bacterium]|nr:hypothetical protein [Acidimicrobiia bacterium]